MFTTDNVKVDHELGYINVKKQDVKKAARPLLTLLRDFAYLSTCVTDDDEILDSQPAQRLQYRINEMSFALMGLTNWGPNLLIKYESSPCYADWKYNFVTKGFIGFCACDVGSDCEVHKITVAMYGIAMDVIKILRDEFQSVLTMESVFGRRNMLEFIKRFTTRVALNQFLVKPKVARTYTFDNTKQNLTIEFFKDHILSKEEALEPKRFNPVITTRADPFVGDTVEN